MLLESRVLTALYRLQRHGHEAFIVGGCIRDSLMGNTPKDWDICTSALPQETAACFPDYPQIETGLKHGTLTIVLDDLPLEITTYRIDGSYSNLRQPDSVGFSSSLQEDLARRDFTINAMAYNPEAGLIDPYNGQQDIQRGIIRCVGNADTSFQEDALRIMRALRFASQLGFQMADDAAQSIHANRQLLRALAVERLADELTRILQGAEVVPVLLAYADVLEVFIPEISPMLGLAQNTPYHEYDVWRHTLKSIALVPPTKVLRLTMLLHDSGKPAMHTTDANGVDHFKQHRIKSAEIAQTVLERLRYDNETVSAVVELVGYHDIPIEVSAVRKWLYRIGPQRFKQLLEVKTADDLAKAPGYQAARLAHIADLWEAFAEVVKSGQCFQLKDLAVNGEDLLALGIEPGPQLGFMLNELLLNVMEDQLPNVKAALLAFVRSKLLDEACD